MVGLVAASNHRTARHPGGGPVAHKILVAAYHIMATPGVVYHELGGDYFASRDNPDRRRDRLVAQLAKLGYDVDLTPAEAA